MSEQEQFADLVFEGGGVKGIGLAGALAALHQRGFTPKGVAGTSAGAITAALVAAGYRSDELEAILLEIPFAEFRDEGWEDALPIVGELASVVLQRGIYEGRFLQRWMAELLEAKGITTFAALRDEKAENDAQRYRLRVIASDVTQRKLLVLPDDAPGLGLDPDELEIAYAVRMSTSIPIFFEPVIHRNPATGDDHVIVDGGMLSNFPVWLFDRRDGTPRWPTFGLRLVEPDPRISIADRLPGPEPGAGGSLIDYVKSLAATMMEAHDRLYLENASFARTIAIPTLGVRSTDFDITPERVRALYRSGHEAASRFLDDWDFPAYVEQFRRGTVTSRRAQLQAQRPAG